MRLLIIHPGGLGDVLLAVPAIRGLRRLHNVKEAGLLAAGQIGRLLWQCREVDRIFGSETAEFSCLMAQGSDGSHSRLESWLQDCELAVCWMTDHDGRLAAALRARGVRDTIIGSTMTGVLEQHHQSERFAEVSNLPGLEMQDRHPLILTDEMREAGTAALRRMGLPSDRPYAVMHPGSGGSYKCSDAVILAPILQWMDANGLHPLIIEGPADQAQVRRLQSVATTPLWIVRDTDLLTVAAVIRGAKLYIGHDSGVTHLSAAVGVPTIACFGPTDETRWGPWGPFTEVIRGTPCHCGTREWMQQCIDRPCLQIDPALLATACSRLLSRTSGDM